ncbi:hypothetical protein PT276_08150 [Orbaceae bacterium ESL0721]|nr:hypothetical protein [Orbaceae bacterium ESL0721]
MWQYWVAKGVSDTANYLADVVDYKTKRGMLKTQAKMYEQGAESVLFEGRQNADKISDQGKQAQSSLMADYGSSGVDVNSSQTVNSAQRKLQRGVNDDVFTTMYNAATEANQQTINAQIAKYQNKQLKKGFIFQSIGTWANNAAQAMGGSMLGGGS